ncbi:Uma2 family endonuclease [Streptomyces sp. V2]|nr:Uma2 family endonuclease [Streptomyces sp. V2]
MGAGGPVTQQTPYRRLRALRDRFAPPPGLTWPEISGGKLVMTLRPGPRHQLTAMLVRRQLDTQLPKGLGVFEATDTDDEALGVLRVPDLQVCRDAAMETDDPLDPREIVLAVEIVSPSNPENDYRDKARDYPAMGIPHYLILDPRDGTWTYQWGIGRAEGRPAYDNRLHLPYGKPVTVATDLGTWQIETGDLPRYSAKDMGLSPGQP